MKFTSVPNYLFLMHNIYPHTQIHIHLDFNKSILYLYTNNYYDSSGCFFPLSKCSTSWNNMDQRVMEPPFICRSSSKELSLYQLYSY